MRNNNPDRKPDIIDLYSILKKRRVSLEEWLSFHNISSMEEFDSRAYTIAAEQGCMISADMRTDSEFTLKLAKKNAFYEAAKNAGPLPTGLLATATLETEHKKKKTAKKSSLNENQKEVESKATDSPEADKENLNEDRNN